MKSLSSSIIRVVRQHFCVSRSPWKSKRKMTESQGQPHSNTGHGQHPPQETHQSHNLLSSQSSSYGPKYNSHHPHYNQDLINQSDEHYKQLRALANEEADAMGRCFDESHRAYEAGHGARAKELSDEGHAHQREMNNLNAQASDWIYHANNKDRQPGEIDLHGLYVREAITYTERAIQHAQASGDSEVRLIVGKGLHSPDHIDRLKPAIESFIQKYNFTAHLDEHNSGVLIVVLDGRHHDRALKPDDITRRLERHDEDCVVM